MNADSVLRDALELCWIDDVAAGKARAEACRIGGLRVVNTPLHTVWLRWRDGSVEQCPAVPAGVAHRLALAVESTYAEGGTIWWRGVRGDGRTGQLHVVRVSELAHVTLDAASAEDPA